MPAIETDVKGSPGTCRDTATWLGTLAQGAHEAAAAVRAARGESEATWHGPASESFRDAVNGVDGDADRLGQDATNAANALRDFAGTIDSVAGQMAHARQIARTGGLAVSGTVILPPAAPGPAPMLLMPCTASTPSGTQKPVAANSAAAQAHQQAVNTYNAQVRVFNQAKAIVTSARTTERNAHDALNKAMTDTESESSGLRTIGFAVTQRVLDAIKGSRDGAKELLDRADALHEAANTYQKFATGHLNLMTPGEATLINRLGKESDQLADINEAKATQLEQWIKIVPENVRDAIAADPTKLLSNTSDFAKYFQPYMKSMPYLGSAITISSEAIDMLAGDKSPGKAAIDGGADIVGSSVGGAGGDAVGSWLGGMMSGAELGFEGGSVEPGMGNIVGGVLGGIAGGFIGSEGVKHIVDSLPGPGTDQKAQQNFQHTNYGSTSMTYPG